MRWVGFALWCTVLANVCWAQTETASPNQACYTPALQNDRDLDTSDPRVVPGGSVFRRDHHEYPFATLSVAAKDPTAPDSRVCFRYEIKCTGDEEIRSFRWKDIELGFVDVDKQHPVRWYNTAFTKYDWVGKVSTSVGAFERSVATTTALLPVEQVEQEHLGNGARIFEYKLTDRFPSAVPVLAEAHMPLTPVLAVPAKIAPEIPPLVSKFRSGETELTVFTSSKFSGKSYLIDTNIRIDGPGRAEAELFAPALNAKSAIFEPINADAIVRFVKHIDKDGHERKPIVDGVFDSFTELAAFGDTTVPAFFIVKYPVTVRAKERSFCITVSGFSAYPVNLDDWYCEKK
jgi:hypothetical protein